jgi:hypothetical protein
MSGTSGKSHAVFVSDSPATTQPHSMDTHTPPYSHTSKLAGFLPQGQGQHISQPGSFLTRQLSCGSHVETKQSYNSNVSIRTALRVTL